LSARVRLFPNAAHLPPPTRCNLGGRGGGKRCARTRSAAGPLAAVVVDAHSGQFVVADPAVREVARPVLREERRRLGARGVDVEVAAESVGRPRAGLVVEPARDVVEAGLDEVEVPALTFGAGTPRTVLGHDHVGDVVVVAVAVPAAPVPPVPPVPAVPAAGRAGGLPG